MTRGLSTGLIEQRDFASGTSSRSSKLIHGGLRYLEMLDFGLVREALHERGLLLTRLAPHLVRPVPFLYPLNHHVWERAYVGSGIALYDAMAMAASGGAGLPHHRHLTRRQAPAPHAEPEARRPHRGGAVLRRPGRRRPPHDGARPHGRRTTAPTSRTALLPLASCARASASPAYAPSTSSPTRSSSSTPGRSSTRRVSGPTTPRRWSASAGSSTCGRPRASTSSCRATGSTPRPA